MTEMTDFERLIASWMEADGPRDVPDRVVHAALREARGVEQRRDVSGKVIRWLPRDATATATVGRQRHGRFRRLGLALLAAILLVAFAAAAVFVGSLVLRSDQDSVGPPCPRAFCATGSLDEARSFHTATLLPDGRVLAVGGFHDFNAGRTSAEVWDSATDRFDPTGPLAEGRFGHTATLLPDGRVLIVGGNSEGSGLSASAELWDPAVGAFAPAGSPTEARADHTAMPSQSPLRALRLCGSRRTMATDSRSLTAGLVSFDGRSTLGDTQKGVQHEPPFIRRAHHRGCSRRLRRPRLGQRDIGPGGQPG
jgi:hypothetical protein